MDAYMHEARINEDSNPLEWWHQRENSYKLMSRLAKKYLAIMASSTPAERIMSALGNILTKKRQRMSGELFSDFMFLSDVNVTDVD